MRASRDWGATKITTGRGKEYKKKKQKRRPGQGSAVFRGSRDRGSKRTGRANNGRERENGGREGGTGMRRE